MSIDSILATTDYPLSFLLFNTINYVKDLYSKNLYFRLAIRIFLIGAPSLLLIKRIYYQYLTKYKGKDKLTGHYLQNNKNNIISYDFIIVGAGSAGCVIASRLALSPYAPKILLIEAGGDDNTLYTNIPAAAIKLQLSSLDWAYKTVPQQHSQKSMIDNRSNWPRGKCLGGCSSINYMLWVRGEREDYNEWVKKGAVGWGWNDLLPYFVKCENISSTALSKTDERGINGPVWIEQLKQTHPSTEAFIKASKRLNIPYIEDYNQSDYTGVSLCQYNTHKGRRWNTASAYLVPAIDKPNLHILTHAHVTRILFNNNKEAIGVVLRRGKTIDECRSAPDITIFAEKEVILSAGAISSPHLLLLSGIGPSSQLSQFNIPVLAESPGVGSNLQDHLFIPMLYKSLVPTLSNESENLKNLFQIFWSGAGELCSPMVEAFVFLHSGVRDIKPGNKQLCDVQIHFAQGQT